MAKVSFTAGRVAGFKCPPDKNQAFLWDENTPGLGLRTTPAGKPAYVFQGVYQGKDVRITIGAPSAWSVKDAQTKARELQRLIDEGKDPREQKRQHEAAAKAKAAAAEAASKFTLENLLRDYCDHQQAIGRVSYKDALSIFTLHIFKAWPKVAKMPASHVTGEHIADMMRKLVEAGHGRTANKLRSYVRAAYAMARAARSKASIPVKFKDYGITINPGDDTAADESANRADKNPLTLAELRTYWQTIKGMDTFEGAVLRLHLLTGGQRIEQLVKLRTADILPDRFTIMDGKGRPGKPPRPHTVPLIPAAALALNQCAPRGEYALSTRNGRTPLSSSALSDWAKEAASTAPDNALAGFATKRIRSGVETALAAARISSDTRGRLQSHGIAGVQARHYDAHDYLDEKRHALETLFNLLDRPDHTNVVTFTKAG